MSKTYVKNKKGLGLSQRNFFLYESHTWYNPCESNVSVYICKPVQCGYSCFSFSVHTSIHRRVVNENRHENQQLKHCCIYFRILWKDARNELAALGAVPQVQDIAHLHTILTFGVTGTRSFCSSQLFFFFFAEIRTVAEPILIVRGTVRSWHILAPIQFQHEFLSYSSTSPRDR